ncbi:uncharacterized protein LOC134578522 [Pelobates fuscus]|uniref:uncharacterized protein LOC134578522 n=1 Tax=Pelobates fuscus TaxID=191477 RepID=UPI002FE489EA
MSNPSPNPANTPRPPAVCHYCKQPGHYKNQCPRLNRGSWERQPPQQPRAAAHCVQQEGTTHVPNQEEQWSVLHEVNPVQAGGDNRDHHRQWITVDGVGARALRDSGATLTVVQPHTIRAQARTGRTVAVRVAGGAIHKLPTANILVDWGSGSKQLEVGIMQELPAEVLLGNDVGCLTSQLARDTPAEAYPVTTRAQARLEAPLHSEENQMPPCLGWEPC